MNILISVIAFLDVSEYCDRTGCYSGRACLPGLIMRWDPLTCLEIFRDILQSLPPTSGTVHYCCFLHITVK